MGIMITFSRFNFLVQITFPLPSPSCPALNFPRIHGVQVGPDVDGVQVVSGVDGVQFVPNTFKGN